MSRKKDKILRELIAERKRLDRLIEEYQSCNDELASTSECLIKENDYDEDWDDGKYWYDDGSLRIKYPPKNFVNISPTINVSVDCSTHTTVNRETRVDSRLGLGDNACKSIGGLIRGLIE